MKTQAIAALFIATLSSSVFALPSSSQPVLGVSTQGTYIQAEGGSDRTGANRIAESGSDRTNAFRIAEGGSDRTGANRIAESGSDRTNAFRIAEGGADRLPQAQRVS
ncbi:hypothetical protein D3C78_210420 [compost metagenome]